MSKFWMKIGVLVLTLLLFTLLILQNVTPVAVKLLFWSFPLPLIVVMMLFFLGGFVVGLVIASFTYYKRLRER